MLLLEINFDKDAVVGVIYEQYLTHYYFFYHIPTLKCGGTHPWNYARFLDYCTERLFLQRVAGRYRFIHKLLQDHFAQMEFKGNVD
ncbi:MAG: hypothetical protein V7K26_30785 [Nostoc sp.]|uniref:hypothetical protein n=1 Tax=Nostoc sp. TaxID=1180 RepID=UPI002FF18192